MGFEIQTTEILFFRLPMSDFGSRKHPRTSENAPASAQRIPNVVQRCSGALPAPRPGCPAPPSGSSKTYVFLKETIEFPLSKVARNRHPGVNPFVLQSPLRPRAPDTLKVHTFLIFAPPLAPTRRPALRGRRIWAGAGAGGAGMGAGGGRGTAGGP